MAGETAPESFGLLTSFCGCVRWVQNKQGSEDKTFDLPGRSKMFIPSLRIDFSHPKALAIKIILRGFIKGARVKAVPDHNISQIKT